MIQWKTLAIATTLVILPISTYAAKSQSTVNQLISTNQMNKIAQRPHHGKRGRGQNMEKLLQKLDLSSQQSEQIKTIQEQSKSTNQDLREQMKAQHQEMHSLFSSDASTEEIRTEFQASQQLRQQLGTNRFETMLQIREVLTPEQKAQVAELMEQDRHKKPE